MLQCYKNLFPIKYLMDNLPQQIEEIEALTSIYNTEWQPFGDNSYKIRISNDIELFLTLNDDYPSNSPPQYELLAPTLSLEQKKQIAEEFEKIYIDNVGSPVLFQWIEKLKEIVDNLQSNVVPIVEAVVETKESNLSIDFNVIHGPIIEDRKSVFQGHACRVNSQQEATLFIKFLLENRKIAQATHNISAYRIVTTNELILQDCDDDGETQAGRRLLHLLQILDLTNVIVVVSRWYGGIHLGPDRFKHINNAARQVLVEAGFIKT